MTQYYFKLERTSWKSQSLIYDEPGFRLVVYLEMSGVKEYDWVGIDSDFEKWTAPPGETIPVEKRREILERLGEWSQGQGVRIKISPPFSMYKYFEQHQAEIESMGWKIERKAEGIIILERPKRASVWNRIVNLFK